MLRVQNDEENRPVVHPCLIQSFYQLNIFIFRWKKRKAESGRTKWLWNRGRDANRAGENRPSFTEQHLQSECDGSKRRYGKHVGVFPHSEHIQMNASLTLFHIFPGQSLILFKLARSYQGFFFFWWHHISCLFSPWSLCPFIHNLPASKCRWSVGWI